MTPIPTPLPPGFTEYSFFKKVFYPNLISVPNEKMNGRLSKKQGKGN